MGSNIVSDHNSGLQFVENLLHENDVKGAIDFAKRVQTSSLKLKRLSHFLANIVVQVSSEDEETDWYTVLGVDPSADTKTMKQHYVRQANIIRLIGSYEAHKLLNKAWATLSDKVTRKEYDLRRRSREMQQNALAVKQASSANENVSEALSNGNNAVASDQKSSDNNCSIGGSDQMDDFADQREISAMDWEIIWNPEASYAPNEPLDTFLTACPSCHYESHRVCLIGKADCLQCGKAFAAVDVPSPEAKHKENVPENQMPLRSDGERGLYLCQTINSRAEKVGSSESSKGNRKKRLSDVERNISTKKARNVHLNQLHERNAAVMDHSGRNAAAAEGPEEDGFKTGGSGFRFS